MSHINKRTGAILLVVLGVLLTYILLMRPVVGLANNGDFIRVMDNAGLKYFDKDNSNMFFDYITTEFETIPVVPHQLGNDYYVTSQTFLVKFAVFVDNLFTSDDVFDIRFLGFIHMVVFLLSFYFLLKIKTSSQIIKWAMILLFLFVFCDIGYLSYFNSFYSESAAYIFLLLTIVLSVNIIQKDSLNYGLIVLFVISTIIFITAKTQTSVIGFFLLLFPIRLMWIHKTLKDRVILSLVSLTLLLSSAAMFMSTPATIKQVNQYNSIFSGVLKYSSNPEADLESFNVTPEYAILKDTTFFLANKPMDIHTEEFYNNFNKNISNSKVVGFYLKNPAKLFEIINKNSNSLFVVRPDYLGNYEKSEDTSPREKATILSWWSSLKEHFFGKSYLFLYIYIISYSLLLLYLYFKAVKKEHKLHLEYFFMIGVVAVLQIPATIAGEGTNEFEKHLFLFNVLFDVTIFISLLIVVWKLITNNRFFGAKKLN
ncbi:hypothetical protein [Paenibacillus agilis]|uniref:Glycosyltransferase RgtA/B/C/D-like domain-containing protein n=1 Tax=Paenibacillus agilis TaxID=3020863 RepID=A0A559IP26_9BACL|nr:hypothetical protein [Paenibacillus agilis]TVX89404.1 hypothetical protein FPZ44_16600 [Paenibacillus agilis]